MWEGRVIEMQARGKEWYRMNLERELGTDCGPLGQGLLSVKGQKIK